MQIDGAQQNAETAGMSDVDKDRADLRRQQLRAFIKKHGLKIRAWAREAGLKSDGTIRNFLDGGTKSMTQETVSKLARAAKVSVAEIFPENINARVEQGSNAFPKQTVAGISRNKLASDGGEKRTVEYEPLTELVYIIGKVQAGAWMEETYQLPEAEWEEMPQPADPRYPGIQRYALRNVGESMNEVCPNGGIWVFVRFIDLAGQGPSPGNYVIVERRRDGMVEATCKQFRLDANGNPGLYPCSRDQSFKPIPLEDGDPEYNEIKIAGRVTDILNRV